MTCYWNYRFQIRNDREKALLFYEMALQMYFSRLIDGVFNLYRVLSQLIRSRDIALRCSSNSQALHSKALLTSLIAGCHITETGRVLQRRCDTLVSEATFVKLFTYFLRSICTWCSFKILSIHPAPHFFVLSFKRHFHNPEVLAYSGLVREISSSYNQHFIIRFNDSTMIAPSKKTKKWSRVDLPWSV